MTFSSFKSFGTLKNQRILKQGFQYTCDTYDSSGLFNNVTNKYDGIFNNSAIISTVSPAVGTACLTMNANYFVTLPFYTNSPSGFSVCFWVKTNSNARYSRILEFGHLRIFIFNLSNLSFQAGGSGTVYAAYPNFTDNVWRHFTFVMNPDKSVIIYANGIYYTTINIEAFPFINNIGYIGKSFGSDPLFIGSIDDMRLYDNKLLSAEEVQQIYTNPYP